MDPKISFLAIGDELVDGSRVDLHTQWLASRFHDLGITIKESLLVRDVPSDIKKGLDFLIQNNTTGPLILITSGGLGPTSDDRTIEALSDYFGWKREIHQASLDHIKEVFKKVNIEFGVGQEKQCLLPIDGQVLANPWGTAPGIFKAESENLFVVVLPGPPNELHPMVNDQVIPQIKKHLKLPHLRTHILQVFNTPESSISKAIKKEDDEVNQLSQKGIPIRLSYREKRPRVFVKVEWRDQKNDSVGQELFSRIKDNLSDSFCLESDLEDMEELIIPKCIENKWTIAVAESCTGGWISQRLTSVSGSSAVINTNFVTYADQSKQEFLGVAADVLKQKGAVSQEVAAAMAQGVAQKMGTTFGLGITGVAGPTGGSAEKPVGLVFVGLYDARDGSTEVMKKKFPGDRHFNRLFSVEMALGMLLKTTSA